MNADKANTILGILQGYSNEFHVAGSMRRGKTEDIHDVDVIFTGKTLPPMPFKPYVQGPRITRFFVMDEQVDIYSVTPEHFGAMMLFLTGPQQYNIIMRAKAKRKGLKLNQYGLYDRITDDLIASRTEEDIYAAMDLKYKEPKTRGVRK
jgi:DNA polymerase (family 10)